MYKPYNPNPLYNRVGDCTVRAITKLTSDSWDKTYTGLCVQGYAMCDMPSSNAVWGEYLRDTGYERHIIPNECPDCYTVEQFCIDHPTGKYLLALSSHVVTVQDGDYYDLWDSGQEVPLYYWKRKEE